MPHCHVRILPSESEGPLEEIALARLRSRYEGQVLREVGYTAAVLSAKVGREGILMLRPSVSKVAAEVRGKGGGN